MKDAYQILSSHNSYVFSSAVFSFEMERVDDRSLLRVVSPSDGVVSEDPSLRDESLSGPPKILVQLLPMLASELANGLTEVIELFLLDGRQVEGRVQRGS